MCEVYPYPRPLTRAPRLWEGPPNLVRPGRTSRQAPRRQPADLHTYIVRYAWTGQDAAMGILADGRGQRVGGRANEKKKSCITNATIIIKTSLIGGLLP